MLTRQRQLGAQIAPGITLFPSLSLFFFFKKNQVFTINDQSTEAYLSEG